MSKIFSIVTKCDTKADILFFEKCYKSIRKFHPHDDIVIVDSDSKLNKHYSYMMSLDKTYVLEIKNKNYETGAIWAVYENFERDVYIFMQDSMVLKSNIDTFLYHDLIHFSDYRGWWDPDDYEHNWAKEIMKECDYEYMEDDNEYKMLQFNSMVCKRNLLDRLRNKNLHKILPTNKKQSQAMERIFGMALHQEGYKENLICFSENEIYKEFRKRI
jgi:hypothetical protein